MMILMYSYEKERNTPKDGNMIPIGQNTIFRWAAQPPSRFSCGIFFLIYLDTTGFQT